MPFHTNLQYLRLQHRFTQERLAMLLGVSRQSISKWESNKAYPEMDKLLTICELFDCTMDELVMGDLTTSGTRYDRAPQAGHTDGFAQADNAAGLTIDESGDDGNHGASADSADSGNSINESSGDAASQPTQDMIGYDEHARRFSLSAAMGVAALILGVAVGELFDGTQSILGANAANDTLMFISIACGGIAGMALLIPSSMSHAQFRRRHPFVEDFYTDANRSRAARQFAFGLVFATALMAIGVAVISWKDDVSGVDDGWPTSLFLALCAAGVGLIVYTTMRKSLMNIRRYNAKAERDEGVRDPHNELLDRSIGASCATIMITATIISIIGNSVFHAPISNIAWPIGGLLCGIVSVIIGIFRHQDKRS